MVNLHELMEDMGLEWDKGGRIVHTKSQTKVGHDEAGIRPGHASNRPIVHHERVAVSARATVPRTSLEYRPAHEAPCRVGRTRKPNAHVPLEFTHPGAHPRTQSLVALLLWQCESIARSEGRTSREVLGEELVRVAECMRVAGWMLLFLWLAHTHM